VENGAELLGDDVLAPPGLPGEHGWLPFLHRDREFPLQFGDSLGHPLNPGQFRLAGLTNGMGIGWSGVKVGGGGIDRGVSNGAPDKVQNSQVDSKRWYLLSEGGNLLLETHRLLLQSGDDLVLAGDNLLFIISLECIRSFYLLFIFDCTDGLFNFRIIFVTKQFLELLLVQIQKVGDTCKRVNG